MSDKQLLKVLRLAKKDPGDPGRTAKELTIELYGVDNQFNRRKLWDRLGPEIDAGRASCGKALRLNRGGSWHGEPVYRVTA